MKIESHAAINALTDSRRDSAFAAASSLPGKSLPAERTQGGYEPTNQTLVMQGRGAAVMSGYDLKNISPREMADMSLALYENNVISLEEHAMLSFQPELNPDQFQQVFGTPAAPDAKRDFIQEWENKLSAQEASDAPPQFIEKTKSLVALLKNLDALG